MSVATWVWVLTLGGLSAVLLADLLIIGRRPHEPSTRESLLWVSLYVGLAMLFGCGVLVATGPRYAGEFLAGWLTEYSLSIDNLFVFVLIMSRFAVPLVHQQRVLMIGIILALLLRGAFVVAGVAIINQLLWVFYLFGSFLLYTGVRLARQRDGDEKEFTENMLIRWSCRVIPVLPDYHEGRMTVLVDRRRMLTPMLIVMIAVGTTDLIFALDSIPVIFGLTREPYLIVTANVLALMGLRQLYFLLGGLLERLVYLSAGLAVVLMFVGVKLVLEALHENNVPFINGGDPVGWAPTVPVWLSLSFIVVTMGVTTAASLIRSRREMVAVAQAE